MAENPKEKVVYKGACFCGAVSFEASGKPLFRVQCHCTICQRYHGADSVSLVAFSPDQFHVSCKGSATTKGFSTSEGMTRHRCSECGGPVYNQSHLEEMPFVDTPLSLFERDEKERLLHFSELSPECHLFWHSRHQALPADLPKWASYPGVGEPIQ
ncbi:CENP-V/GFA domain-containing protein [Balamuthia mandrillaris]